MKYYKKEKVEIVNSYKVVKLGCNGCKKDILDGHYYFKVTEYPTFPEDSLCYKHFCKDCLKKYLKDMAEDDYFYQTHIEFEEKEFYDDYEDEIDMFSDIEVL